MSLIEQLGGYEEARNSLQWLIENEGDYIQEESNLYHACLQYRRENNIFEVGDWVIPIKQPESEFMHAIQIERIGVYGGFYDTKWRLLSISKFRHATPEEIKAGHKL